MGDKHGEIFACRNDLCFGVVGRNHDANEGEHAIPLRFLVDGMTSHGICLLMSFWILVITQARKEAETLLLRIINGLPKQAIGARLRC